MTQDDFGTPKPLPRGFVTTDEVATAGGIERGSVQDWVRAGLLPVPESTGGRGNFSRWHPFSVTLAKFIREQRAQGFTIPEIRGRIVMAFGERILELLPPPRKSRNELTKEKRAKKSRTTRSPRSRR